MRKRPQNPIKSGAPPCGLYLRWTDNRPLADVVAVLRPVFRVMNASQYERNMHIVEWDAGTSLSPEELKALTAFCAYNGIVFIVRNDIGAGRECGAEGVILDDVARLPIAREAFGEEGILGVRCAESQEQAQAALATGADYVAFGSPARGLPSPALAAWWSTLTDTPCVMEGAITNDDCLHYVKSGAGFIEATSYVFPHPGGVMQGTVDMLHAIDLAAQTERKH